MGLLSRSALLPLGLALGLGSGCTRATTTSQGKAEEAPQDTTEAPKDALRPRQIVTEEDVRRLAPGQPIEEVLAGRFPGVIVTRVPGGVSVRIRGAESFYGSTEPLYVIDGLPIQPMPGGGLSGINPYDIESIQVLKDPAETALYGVRGANGVIIIKTKRPGR
jgi:TonB-dependent SusC/RagA subfamily outer membrane receptor